MYTTSRRTAVWVGVSSVVLCLAGCSKDERADKEKAALEALQVYGAKTEMNGEGRVVKLKLEGPGVDDAALDHIHNFPELESLSLYGSSVTDAGLAKLREATRLKALGLGKTKVTRRGLLHIENLPALRWVWLTEDPQLSEKDIADFKSRAVPGLTVYTR